MNKIAFVCLSLAVALPCVSMEYRQLTEEEKKLIAADATKLAPDVREKRKEAVRLCNLLRDGGRMRMPGTPAGTIRIVNLQKRVASADIAPVTKAFNSFKPYDLKIVEADCKANLKFSVIDEPSKPALSLCPDEGIAVINVAALADAKTAQKPAFLAARVRKEIVRAFAYMTAGSTYGTPVFCRMSKPSDLDDCAGETFPMDVIMRASHYLSKAGVVPAEDVSYRLVLKRGFDIAPTNEFQRVIYDKMKKEADKAK